MSDRERHGRAGPQLARVIVAATEAVEIAGDAKDLATEANIRSRTAAAGVHDLDVRVTTLTHLVNDILTLLRPTG